MVEKESQSKYQFFSFVKKSTTKKIKFCGRLKKQFKTTLHSRRFEHFFKISPKRRQFVRKKKTDDTRWRGNHRLPASKTPCTLRGATTEWLSCLNLYRHPSWCRCCSRSLIINFVNSFPCLFVKQLWIVDNDYWEEFMHARVWVKKERKRRRVFFFFLNIIRANDCREREKDDARAYLQCV